MANIKDADNKIYTISLKDGNKVLNIIPYTNECGMAVRYKMNLDKDLVVTEETIRKIVIELIGIGEL